MGFYRTTTFSKARTCPSSQTLERYARAGLTRGQSRRVESHLAACDFCGAEALLLARHPPAAANEAFITPIPAALRRLAEDLLGVHAPALRLLAEVNFRRAPLTLTDA